MGDQIDAWIKAAARPAPFDAPNVLAGIALEDADVVFLGELNHFVHERSDFRALFARALIPRGYDAFAEELGWADGLRLQRYFATRDESVFDRISLFGWKGDQRPDRDDSASIFRASLASYPSALMRAEQTRLYRTLMPRAFFGLDVAADVGGAYAELAVLGGADWRAALARRPGETLAREIERLAGLQPPAGGRATLAALIDQLRYAALLQPARAYEDTRVAMAFREDAMKRRFADARAAAGGRFVLMAHATHLAKDDADLALGGVGPGGGLTSSLGHHIVQELGLRAYAIWMIYGAGSGSQPLTDLPRKARFGSDTLNVRLAKRFDKPVLIPTRDAPAAPMTIGHMYNGTLRASLPPQMDAIYFVPRVSPMRM